MSWIIKPLDGKYYGTVVENTETGEELNVWMDFVGDYTASSREKAKGWGKDGDKYYDHVELQRSYDIAEVICKALNQSGL